jgi:hypothetical protein
MTLAPELNTKLFKLIHLSSHENLLLKSVTPFYDTLTNTKEFIEIINSESPISIRLIDYFVTKFSKKNKVSYKLNDISNNNQFNVYQSYKQKLKEFQKKNFDPFARGVRIPYFIDDICIITTIGQLNFFKWFISKNILEYITKYKDTIEIDMNRNKKNKSDIKIKAFNKLYKKNHIKINNCITNTNSINKVKNNILVTF